MVWGLAGIGGAALLLAILLKREGLADRVQVALFLIAGIGLTGGLLGSLIGTIGNLFTSIGAVFTKLAFGVALPAVLVVMLALHVGLRLKPKGKPQKKLTWLWALTLGTTIGVFGINFADLLGNHAAPAVSAAWTQLVSEVQSALREV